MEIMAGCSQFSQNFSASHYIIFLNAPPQSPVLELFCAYWGSGYAGTLSTTGKCKNSSPLCQGTVLHHSHYLICTIPTLDCIPDNLIRLHLNIKACSITLVYSRILRLISIIYHTIFPIFNISMNFHIIITAKPVTDLFF